MLNDAQKADHESFLKEGKLERSMVFQRSIYAEIQTLRSDQDACRKSSSLFKKVYEVSKKRICCNPRLCRDQDTANFTI